MFHARKIILTTVLTMGAAAAWSLGAAARPPAPWPGPKGDYVFVEGESFQIEGKGWEVKDSPRGSRSDKQSGLKYLSGSAAGNGKAVRQIEIPSDGAYTVWVHYGQAQDADAAERAPFKVEVTQGGRTVLTGNFDEEFEPKAKKRKHPSDYGWDSAQGTLKKGPATIAFEKIATKKAKRVSAHARQIDCLVLTTDAKYKPDYRDFAPQTYARIRVTQSDPAKIYFHGFLNHMRAPWYQNIAIGKTGWASAVNVADAQYLSGGESTPWMNLSRLLYSDSDTNLSLEATVHYHHPDATSSAFAIDFATAPDEKAIVATAQRSGPGAGLKVRIPPDLTAGKKPISDIQYAQENLKLAKQLTVPSFGRAVKRFPIMVGMGSNDSNSAPGTQAAELDVLKILGVDGLWNAVDKMSVAAGMTWGRTGATVMRYRGPAGYADPQMEGMEQSVAAEGKQLNANPLHGHYVATSLTDEGGPAPLRTMAGKPVYDQAFVKWLKEQKLEPKDLGVSDWNQVHLTAERDAPRPALYLYSQRFRAWSVAHFFHLATTLVRKYYPPKALATQNFSDGAVYEANFYSQGNDYFTWFRNEALDLAWSEDWTNGGSTPQICGWNVALLRAATREHHQPIGMYDITSYHRTPLDMKLKAYSDIAQGAKILSIFSYSPLYQGHEPGWYMKAPTYAALMELTREVGPAEDVLLEAMPRPASTAIIYSRDYDIWNVGFDNSEGHERMHTWLALRQSQDAVDVVDGEDVIQGELENRKVAYLFGEQLDHRCIEPIAKWVKAGGTLMLAPGAGSRDELNHPNDALDRALGISRRPMQRPQKYWNASRYLGERTPQSQGKVKLGGQSIDYYFVRQDLSAGAGDTVLATFSDGKPAYVVHAAGGGRVAMAGFLPAISYIRSALVNFDAHKSDAVAPLACVRQAMAVETPNGPTTVERARYSGAAPASAFNAALRQLITWPVTSAKVAQPVQADAPLVEATFMEGKTGWVIPLANYSGAPLKELTVTVNVGDHAFGEVRSSRQGVLQTEPAGAGMIRVRLPLESTDMVYAEWKK
jgi:hypothetical protein